MLLHCAPHVTCFLLTLVLAINGVPLDDRQLKMNSGLKVDDGKLAPAGRLQVHLRDQDGGQVGTENGNNDNNKPTLFGFNRTHVITSLAAGASILMLVLFASVFCCCCATRATSGRRGRHSSEDSSSSSATEPKKKKKRVGKKKKKAHK